MKKIEKFVFTNTDIKKLYDYSAHLSNMCTGINCYEILCYDCPLYPFHKQMVQFKNDFDNFLMKQEVVDDEGN